MANEKQDLSWVDRHPRPTRPAEEVAVPAAAAEAVAAGKAAPQHQCTRTTITTTGSNGDEGRFKGKNGKPNYIGNYSKGLPHDKFGEVDRAAYQTLLDALKSGTDFDKITLGPGKRPLTNPQAGLASDVEGPDPKSLDILSAPRLDSAEEAAEAVELYWMALLRDVPFTAFDGHADVKAAAKELSKLKDFTGPKVGGKVTPGTIFRGCSMGDTDGPLISQFLLRGIGYGSLTIRQRQRTVKPGIDYLTKFDDWLKTQNGEVLGADQLDDERRFIRNMRDMGQYVHVDALYEAYLNACLILLSAGEKDAPFDPGNPYTQGRPDAATQIGFGTFGGPHILSLVTEVATRALKAVWWQKWSVHRRLRPEAYGGLIHVKLEGVGGQKIDYPIHKQVLDSEALKRTHDKYGSYLLPMAFPEGSPTHPAYGAGHATVAGACVTILKAWFREEAPFPLKPVVPNEEGTALEAYSGPGAGSLTIGGELNKVAANIAIGRNMAGVHWRSDYTESVRLGEKVALCILRRQSRDYNEKDWSFTLTSFDGKKITVREGQVLDENGKNIPC